VNCEGKLINISIVPIMRKVYAFEVNHAMSKCKLFVCLTSLTIINLMANFEA
jgi:hypothetical protein